MFYVYPKFYYDFIHLYFIIMIHTFKDANFVWKNALASYSNNI